MFTAKFRKNNSTYSFKRISSARSVKAAIHAVLGTIFLTPSTGFCLDQIIRPYQTSRAAGMGNVRYTTGLYDENFFSNPARTAANPKWRVDLLNVMAEVNKGSLQNADKLTGSGDTIDKVASTAGTNNHVRIQTAMPAVYVPKFFSQRHAFAVGVLHSTQADVDLRRNLSVEPDVISDIGPAVSYAYRFVNNRLVLGTTAHATYRVATNETFSTIDYIRTNNFKLKDAAGEGAHYDFDMGSTFDIPWSPKGWDLNAGAAVNQVLGGKYSNMKVDLIKQTDARPRPQPRTYNMGISAAKNGWLIFNKATFAFEVQDVGNNPNGSLFRTLHFGSELDLTEWIHFRAGINQGYLCAGFGLELKIFTLDLATYGEEMSLNPGGLEDRRYAMKITLGI